MMSKFIYLVVLINFSVQQDISSITDLKTLSELPLEKLLKLKNNFNLEDNYVDDFGPRIKIGNSEALALQAKHKPYSRGGYDMDYFKNKLYHKKDINTIFQLSVTTLAFIAFGGYLLCLIVQAIRLKHSASGSNSDMVAMLVRPGKPASIKKPAQQTKPGGRPRPGNSRYKREVWPDADVNPHKMYDALIMLAEGYTKYNTIEYRHFNDTIKKFSLPTDF